MNTSFFRFIKLSFLLGCIIAWYKPYAQSFDKGQIIDTLRCDNDVTQSYALYLPSYYTKDQQWPIVYIFDPAARGALPVQIFKESAEELGYIIVCSNNSRNGSWQIMFDAAWAMKKDTELKFNIDPERVYTSGFSGGSRGAMVMGKAVYHAKGILACGGAYPSDSKYMIKPEDSICYAAIVGYVDMNYLEHQLMSKELTHSGIENVLFITKSPHQWASSNEVFRAMEWLDMKTNNRITEERKIKTKADLTSYGDSLLIGSDVVYALPLLQQLEKDWQLSFKEEPSSLLGRKEIQKENKEKEKQEDREQIEQDEYIKLFYELPQTRLNPAWDSIHTVNWWKLEINKWKRKEGSENIFVSRSAKRLLNFIWAGFAESSFRYEETQDFEFALQLNSIWQYAQPESVWASYSRARIFARTGNDSEAIEELNHAHALGMRWKASITREPAFDKLRTYDSYQTLLNQLE